MEYFLHVCLVSYSYYLILRIPWSKYSFCMRESHLILNIFSHLSMTVTICMCNYNYWSLGKQPITNPRLIHVITNWLKKKYTGEYNFREGSEHLLQLIINTVYQIIRLGQDIIITDDSRAINKMHRFWNSFLRQTELLKCPSSKSYWWSLWEIPLCCSL